MKISIGHQEHFKLIFAGAFGVGKTTALKTISDTEVISTDVSSFEVSEQQIAAGKHTTTVGLDYGELRLPDGSLVALFGLPGQQRFDQMWDSVLKSHSGVLLWLYGNKSNALSECQEWLEILHKRNATKRLCVTLTRMNEPASNNDIAPFRSLVRRYNPYAPVVTADPRKKESVIRAVLMAIGTPSI